MDVNELLRQYAQGKRDFGFVNLQGVVLTRVDLTGIALYQANLEKAVLVQVNLSRANLRQSNLKEADLSQANLSQANLRRANLTDAILEGTILDGATLTGAILPDGTYYLSPPSQDTEIQPISSIEDDYYICKNIEFFPLNKGGWGGVNIWRRTLKTRPSSLNHCLFISPPLFLAHLWLPCSQFPIMLISR